jgi:hypothetical protein
VIIDAGSSGSRIHVFKCARAHTHTNTHTHRKHARAQTHRSAPVSLLTRACALFRTAPQTHRRFQQRPGRTPRVLSAPAVHKQTPGLSAFAAAPQLAAAQLDALLAFAAARVPSAAASLTPVVLLATAGLRLLPSATAEDILAACRPRLAASRFLFRPEWAHVLPGADEGAFAWVAANYAIGTLEGGDPFETVGVLELGGASAQVTFVPAAAVPKAYRKDVRLPAGGGAGGAEGRVVRYSLYTHSFLGMGLDAARDARTPPPPGARDACAPRAPWGQLPSDMRDGGGAGGGGGGGAGGGARAARGAAAALARWRRRAAGGDAAAHAAAAAADAAAGTSGAVAADFLVRARDDGR